MTRVLGRDDAIVLVAAGTCLARVKAPAQAVAEAGRWVLATMGERIDVPPVGVIADVGAILFGGTLRPGVPVPADDPALASAVRRYEDAVLGRLAVDSRLASAGMAVARLPPPFHPQAVGILVAGILRRIELEAGLVEVPPGIVRELMEKRPEETVARGYVLLRDDAVVRQRLGEAYAALARAAQKARDLLGDADLFALENLTVLGTLTQRLAIGDVVLAQEALAERIPKRLPRRRRREGDVAARLEDESAYPVGGFSSVSTSGSLENLVTSELIYMDPPGAGSDVDLFDMRYVEGELLYYTRDEAIFVRRRRLVVVALGPELVQARVKDRELPWQRIVLVLAVVLVLTKKLVELLGEEALRIQVSFLHEEGIAAPLGDEKGLAELMLREWRDNGTVEVGEATWPEVVAVASAGVRHSLVEVVRVGSAAQGGALDPRVVVAHFTPPGGPLEAWSQAASDLLSELL